MCVSLPEVDQDHAGREAESVQDGRIDVDWTTRGHGESGTGALKSTIGVPGTGMSYCTSTSKNTSTRNATLRSGSRRLEPRSQRSRKTTSGCWMRSARRTSPNSTRSPAKESPSTPCRQDAHAGLIANETGPAWKRQMLEWVWAQGQDPAEYRLVKTTIWVNTAPNPDHARDRNRRGARTQPGRTHAR